MKTILLILFFTLNLHAQAPKGMVKINGYTSEIVVEVKGEQYHEIKVADSLIWETVNRWKYEMRKGEVEFQAPLRKIDRIEYIDKDAYYISEIKDRVIYLNSEFKKYPFCTRAAVIQMLFVNNGGKVCKCEGTRVNETFIMNDDNEDTFRRQYKRGYMFSYLIDELK